VGLVVGGRGGARALGGGSLGRGARPHVGCRRGPPAPGGWMARRPRPGLGRRPWPRPCRGTAPHRRRPLRLRRPRRRHGRRQRDLRQHGRRRRRATRRPRLAGGPGWLLARRRRERPLANHPGAGRGLGTGAPPRRAASGGPARERAAAALRVVGVRRRGVVPGTRTRRTAPRPGARRADHGRPHRAATARRRRRPAAPGAARPRGLAARAGAGGHRSAQPGAGPGPVGGRGDRRPGHAQAPARRLPRRAPRGGGVVDLAGRGSASRRRTAIAGSTNTSVPTDDCAATGPPATAPPAA
jgi:hypothetical protein